MKINLIAIFYSLVLISCYTPHRTVVSETTTEVKEQKNLVPRTAIIGRWKMESLQVYSSIHGSEYGREIIWEFINKREVLTTNILEENAPMDAGRYWMNQKIINVNGQLYLYSFDEPFDISDKPNSKRLGDELWLDSKIDPSISNIGSKIHFIRIQ